MRPTPIAPPRSPSGTGILPVRRDAVTRCIPTLKAKAKRLLPLLAVVLTLPAAAHAAPFDHPTSPEKLLQRYYPEETPELKFPAYFGTEEKAAAEVNAGKYRKALYTLHAVDPASEKAAVTRAQAHAALGEWDKAIGAVSGETVKEKPGVQVQRARLLAAVGQTKEARDLLKEHLSKNPGSVAGHFELGRISEAMGDLVAAREQYAYFVRPERNHLQLFKDEKEKPYASADELVTVARALDRWAALESKYKDNTDLNNTILAMFTRAYDVMDRTSAAAHLAAAEFLNGHDDFDKTTGELDAALAINPRLSRAFEIYGELSLHRFDFERAEAAAGKIRETDPTSLQADLLDARTQLHSRRPDLAEPILRRILEKRPDQLEAYGLLAAVLALRLDDKGAEELLQKADVVAPGHPAARYELAEQLSSNRQYPRAAANYQAAIERAPWWTAPRNGLGLLYTQWGEEEKAHATLEEARHLDPYNLETTNYIRLLDRLQTMSAVSSEHFVVRFDQAEDPIIGPMMLEYMEAVNSDLVGIFGHQPAVTTYIEVFPTHAQFSVRTAGIPFIGTVGASTGRVIALVAPRDGNDTMGTYNWAQVLRHEYAHTVTLGATENRIPHWMTEGLAVYAEESPLRWEWVPMLYYGVTHDELFPIDRLTWGFVRPKRPIDRQLAYAQSYWMCKYLIETYSRDAMLQLLARFKAGRTQDEAFQDVLSMSAKQFHLDFLDYARQQVRSWGYDKESSEKYEKLRDAGDLQVKGKMYEEAAKTWEEIAKLRPVDALPHQRLAGLYLTKELNQPAKAREHLAILNKVELKENRYAKRLARLSETLGDLPGAISYAKQATWSVPYDLDAHKLVLDLAQKAGDEKLIALQKQRIEIIEGMKKKETAPADRKAAPIEPG